MTFDAQRFCDEQGIHSTTKGKHSKAGWVQIRCPFCTGNPGWHGGFNIQSGYYNCRRCGYHWMPRVISRLLEIPIRQAFTAIRKYSAGQVSVSRKEHTRFQKYGTIKLPPGTSYVADSHKIYLKNIRRFSKYQKIIRLWQLKSTGTYGPYAHRILAPIYFEHQLVSYQCRSTAPDHNPPYKACAKTDELVHHKHILYGFDFAVPKNRCVVVEGITDVWRLGPGAVATFGKGFTPEQIRVLVNNFETIYRLFDTDANQEDQLEKSLSDAGIDPYTVNLSHGDPGQLTDGQAEELMKDIGF